MSEQEYRRSKEVRDQNLLSLKAVTDEAYNMAVSADWNEDPKAEFLWREYRRLKERLERGEIYEPKF